MQSLGLEACNTLAQLQEVAEQLQTSIATYSHLGSSHLPLDLHAVLKHAHRIAYTSYAPLGHDPSQPLPQHFRPPNPQEWQLRASQLHQFQAERDQKKAEGQAASRAAPAEQSQAPSAVPAAQLPPGLKLPPMPKGWKPGMPIPGLDQMLSGQVMDPHTATPPAAMPAQAGPQPQHSLAPLAASGSPPSAAATTQLSVEPQLASPGIETQPPAQPALRPAPFIPDFVLNPTLEAVEEEYSSSDYSDEEI